MNDDKLYSQYVNKDVPDDQIIDSIFTERRTQHADDAIDYEDIDELADDDERPNLPDEEFQTFLGVDELEAQQMAEDQFENMFGGDDKEDINHNNLELDLFDDENTKKHQLELQEQREVKRRKLIKIVERLEKKRMKNNIRYHFPNYSKHKPFNFHEFSQLPPKFFKFQKPNRPLKPLIPKVTLEIDVDQRKFKQSDSHNITGITQADLDFIHDLENKRSSIESFLKEIDYVKRDWTNDDKFENFSKDLILSTTDWDDEAIINAGDDERPAPINLQQISSDDEYDDNIFEGNIDTEIKLDMNDPNLLFVPRKFTDKSKSLMPTNESLIDRKFNFSNDKDYELLRRNYNTKQRSQLSNLNIEHSTPALRLQTPYFKVRLNKFDTRSFHRPAFNIRSGSLISFSKIKQRKKKKDKNRSFQQIFKKTSDLTAGDSASLVSMEYAEQYPPILSNFGMSSKLINYYRKEKADDTSRPKAPIGETHVLGVEDRSPFWNFGEVAPGDFVPTLYNNMIRAPIFKHDAKPTDFLLIRSQGGASHQKFYLKNMNFNFAVGNTFPVEVPAPHSRKVTNISKNRLKMIVFRVMNNKGAPRISVKDVSKHFPEHTDMQNRQRLKEFMEYQRSGDDQGFWKVRGMNDVIPSEEEIRAMITPEDVCLLDTMQAGQTQLENSTLFTEFDSRRKENEIEEDGETGAEVTLEEQLTPWNLSRNFVISNMTKQLLQLNGEGDPTGIGLGYSFLKSTQKNGFKPLFPPPPENVPKAATAAYTLRLYNEEIKRIWYSQRSSLVDNQREDPLANLKITKNDHNKFVNEELSDDQVLKITRRVKDKNNVVIRKTSYITDPNVIQFYIRRKEQIQNDYIKQLETSELVPTTDESMNSIKRKLLIKKMENLEKRRTSKSKIPDFKAAAAEGAKIIDANTVMLPDGSYVIGGKGIGKGKSRTRRCATCGAFGHIKTNKQCPMYNQTLGDQSPEKEKSVSL